jgi:hypothetical protein
VRASTCRLVLSVALSVCGFVACSSTDPASQTTRSGVDVNEPASLVHEDFSGLHFGLSFDHPAQWTSQPFAFSSSFSQSITYLSPMTISNPCTDTSTPGRLDTACSLPVTQLQPRSVLVTWSSVGFPRPAGQPEIPEPNTTIGGRTAHVETTRPGSCDNIGADETIIADIERPSGNHYEMTACLRGPGLGEQERSVTAMLDSTHVTS